MAKAILFVVGASGAGKTSALQTLAVRDAWNDRCYFFDSIQVPSTYEMERLRKEGESWQEKATEQWVERLLSDPEPVVVLEGQTRPSFIRAALSPQLNVLTQIVLLDCRSEVRRQRLIESRGQPELASIEMDNWSAYLRGQADALDIPVIDTSDVTIETVTTQLEQSAERLLERLSIAALTANQVDGKLPALGTVVTAIDKSKISQDVMVDKKYEDQLFDIFYESQVRQKVELDAAHIESREFRRSQREYFNQWRSNKAAHWIVVERDDKPVAYAATDYNSLKRGFGIGNLGVSSTIRGRGIGEELMEHVISTAKEMGAVSVGLSVHKNNKEARALYEKMKLSYEANCYLDMVLKL